MRQVAILGIGQTKIDEHWEKSIRDLAAEAIRAALQDAGRETVDGLFLGNMMSGILDRQNNLASLVFDFAGLYGGESVKIDAACGSGGAALRA
ncbi:MAG: thiolase domain-containing protein, partial [Anaerolineales bacterium]|nr:thiolase domain-containing protein [Anaerolineales bacterium]